MVIPMLWRKVAPTATLSRGVCSEAAAPESSVISSWA